MKIQKGSNGQHNAVNVMIPNNYYRSRQFSLAVIKRLWPTYTVGQK